MKEKLLIKYRNIFKQSKLTIKLGVTNAVIN